MMGLVMWFRDDVARLLSGLARAGSRYDGDYRRGYYDALGDLATSFGVRLVADELHQDQDHDRDVVIVQGRNGYRAKNG